MARHPALARSPLLVGLREDELDALSDRMRPRHFDAGEELCRAGEDSDCIWLITGGLVHWFVPTTEGAGDLQLRLRKGDVIGAQDAISGEPRSATVVASISTSTLELAAEDLIDLARRFPQILVNLIRTQRERLFRVNARSAETERGEEIALVAGPSLLGTVGPLVSAARAASPRPIIFLDRKLSFAGALTAADDLVAQHGTVLIPAELEPETLGVLLDEVDRVVALAGTADEAQRLGELSAAAQEQGLEVVLVGDEAAAVARSWPAGSGIDVVRVCPREAEFPLADADLTWIARHLTRTKLGIALGAGGAKGYAHVGVLQVLEEAGYVVDYAGGSSIGGFVATHLALGHAAAAIDERFRAAFNPDTVASLFSTPFGGGSTGVEVLTRLLQEATEGRSFSDAVIPLVIMAVDLTDRAPAPQREGPLWEALLGALAVAGRLPAARARRSSSRRRPRARSRADHLGARGRRRPRAVGQPDGRRDARPLARGARGRGAAASPRTARDARHAAGGHGPQPARHERPARRARRRRRHPALRAGRLARLPSGGPVPRRGTGGGDRAAARAASH